MLTQTSSRQGVPTGEFARTAFHSPGAYGLWAGPQGPVVHADGKTRPFSASAGHKPLTFDTPHDAAEWAKNNGYRSGAVLTQRAADGSGANLGGFAPLGGETPQGAPDPKTAVFRNTMRDGPGGAG